MLLIVFLVFAGIGYAQECENDAHCPEETPYCSNNNCVECLSDDNCSENEFCASDNSCLSTIISYCPKTIDYRYNGKTLTLESNLIDCDNDGIIIDVHQGTISDITIDCKNHSITGTGGNTGILVHTENTYRTLHFQNSIIKNCHIKNFERGISLVAKARASTNCFTRVAGVCRVCDPDTTGREDIKNIDIINNTIEECSQGIRLESDEDHQTDGACEAKKEAPVKNIDIINNILKNNDYGIYTHTHNDHSDNNAKVKDCRIFNNTIINSKEYGIYISRVTELSRDSNIIYNNIIDSAYDPTNKNRWNTEYSCDFPNIIGGRCKGGNYWEDLCTLDDGSGDENPYNIPADGIGDTQKKSITGGSTDNLPLSNDTGCKSWLYAQEDICIPVDGDSDSESCIESKGNWKEILENNPCCGDDEEDYGKISSDGSYLCTINTDGEWEWAYIEFVAGDVFHIAPQNYDILSSTDHWYACDAKDNGIGNFDSDAGTVLKEGKKAENILGREYLCYLNKSIEQFGECSPFRLGSQNDNFPTYGTSFTAGEKIQSTRSPILETEYEFGWEIKKYKKVYYRSITNISSSDSDRKVFEKDKIIAQEENTIYTIECTRSGETTTNTYSDEDHEISSSEDNCTLDVKDGKITLNYTTSTKIETIIATNTSTLTPLEMLYGPKYLGTFNAISCEDYLDDVDLEYRLNTDHPNITLKFENNQSTTLNSYSSVYATIPIPDITENDIQYLPETETYYCGQFGNWHTNLDLTDPLTCENAGYEWTGSKCCGDDIIDDIRDTYNDRGWIGTADYRNYPEVGGCFNGVKIDSNALVGDYNIIKNSSFTKESDLDSWNNSYGLSIIENNYLVVVPNSEISQNLTEEIIRGEEYRLTVNLQTFRNSHINISVITEDQESLGHISSSGYTGDDPVQKTDITSEIPETGDIFVNIFQTEGGEQARIYNLSMELLIQDIMNYNGSFYSCNMDEDEREDILNNSKDILISQNKSMQSCDVLGSYFCAPSGSWQNSSIGAPSGMIRDSPKSLPTDYYEDHTELTETSCCAADYCWNGNRCVPNETNSLNPINPLWMDQNQTKAYLCKGGNWSYTEKKQTWDKSKTGFCPSITECLVNPDGNPNNNYNPETFAGIAGLDSSQSPQCINSDQFIGDHYCENGNWSSRTKFIALQLINLTEKEGIDDYVLFCDHFTNTLNDYSYSSKQDYLRGTSGNDFIGYACDTGSEFECVNNFCILRYTDNNLILPDKTVVAFGTSLNKPIDYPGKSFLKALDFDDTTLCNSVQGTFEKCDEDINGMWYSKDLNSVIFSNQDIDLEPITVWDRIINLFIHPVNTITGLWSVGAGDIFPAKDYNRIYLSTVGGKRITGIIENPESDQELISITYKDFDEDICTSIENYQAVYSTQEIPIFVCIHNESDNTYDLLTDDESLLDSWPDLTSKLRVS